MESEKVMAVMPDEQVVPADGEEQLKAEVTEIELKASQTIIETNEQYEDAAEFGRTIKRQTAQITEFFKPMKTAAHKAHAQICEREKAMLDPLKKAEKIIKAALGDYQMRLEEERRAEEERLRQKSEAEAERKLQEAVDAEENGDDITAEAALEEAAMYQSASITVKTEKPKANGVAAMTDYEITAIVADAVPISINGTVLRPVDESAVLKLIRQSKGTVEIPGITFKEIKKVTIRK